MKTAIIIHGTPERDSYYNPEFPSPSNAHWLPWIQKQLILKDILAQTPEMPAPYNPEYNAWKSIFEGFVINEDTILIGHSCGGGFIVRYLNENPNIKVGKVVLVAPWIDVEKSLDTGMFDFEIRKNIIDQTKGITIFESTDDDEEIKNSINKLKSEIENIKMVTFSEYGHFCIGDMDTEKFPELLAESLN
jgi:predicted alpha/beta hydrolase family esterase